MHGDDSAALSTTALSHVNLHFTIGQIYLKYGQIHLAIWTNINFYCLAKKGNDDSAALVVQAEHPPA